MLTGTGVDRLASENNSPVSSSGCHSIYMCSLQRRAGLLAVASGDDVRLHRRIGGICREVCRHCPLTANLMIYMSCHTCKQISQKHMASGCERDPAAGRARTVVLTGLE